MTGTIILTPYTGAAYRYTVTHDEALKILTAFDKGQNVGYFDDDHMWGHDRPAIRSIEWTPDV